MNPIAAVLHHPIAPSDKDEKQPALLVAPAPDPLLESLEEGRQLEEMIAASAGILRLHPLDRGAEYLQHIKTVAKELILLDSSLQALAAFLAASNSELKMEDRQKNLYVELFTKNNELVQMCLSAVGFCLNKVPQELMQGLQHPDVAASITELGAAQTLDIAQIHALFPHLTALYFGENSLNTEHVAKFHALTRLRVASATCCDKVPFEECQALTTFICDKVEGKNRLPALLLKVRAAPKLHTLDLQNKGWFERDHLPDMAGLRTLHTNCSMLIEEASRKYPLLETLSVSYDVNFSSLPQFPAALSSITLKKPLDYVGSIASALRKNRHLTHVTCAFVAQRGAHPEIPESADMNLDFIRALGALHNLTHLTLELWEHRPDFWKKEHFQMLAANHPKLQEFTLTISQPFTERWIELLSPLKAVPKLTVHAVYYQEIDKEISTKCSAQLPHCTLQYRYGGLKESEKEAESAFYKLGKWSGGKAVFTTLLQRNPQLISHWTRLSMWGWLKTLPKFAREALDAAGSDAANPVKKLDLVQNGHSFSSPAALVELAKRFPHLQQLKLQLRADCAEVITAIARSFQHLHTLHIANDEYDSLMGLSFTDFPQLRRLVIVGDIPAKSLEALRKAAPRLSTLLLNTTIDVSFLSPLAELKELQSLDLSLCDIEGDKQCFLKEANRLFQQLGNALKLPK